MDYTSVPDEDPAGKASTADDDPAAGVRRGPHQRERLSHELRTPLNHIIGFVELLLDRSAGDLNAQQDEYLRDVSESSRHLLALINDILDLSKIEAQKQQFPARRELAVFSRIGQELS